MKFLRKLSSLLSTLMIIVLLALTVLLVGVRVIGLTPYTVLSGSMEPTYHVGSLIYVKEIDPADITVGTPITFVVNEDLLIATHRVVEIECRTTQYQQMTDENGNLLYESDGDPQLEEVALEEPAYYFTTKGDANDVIDGAAVYYKNVIGTPVFSVPYLGYFSNWLQTRKGMIVAICTVLILMLLTLLPDLLRMVDNEPAKKKPDKKAAGSAQQQRKKKPLTPEEKTMILARRKERGEELRAPLTQEERALIIDARRRARASAAQANAAASAAPQIENAAGAQPHRRRRTTSTVE